MAAPMGLRRCVLQALKHDTSALSKYFYSIKPPRWMGGGHFIFEMEDDPTEKPTFDEIMQERNYKDPEIAKVTNIGAAPKLTQYKRRDWMVVRKQNRSNPELERQARHQTLSIPLDEVRDTWHQEHGPSQAHTIAEHYGIYRDLFDGSYFMPSKIVDISYDYDDEYVSPVYRGNRLTPSETSSPPSVDYEADPDSLFTLIMTNPDGHLHDNEQEYLHWMIGNIPGSAVNEGEVLCDYLQPFPPKGTGFHRHVFLLFHQSKKLDFTAHKRPSNCKSLQERTFKTIEFYRQFEEDLTPVGLNFFQCDWDKSVRSVYHDILNMKEPEFEFFHPPPYHPPQKMYPRQEPFDRYYDRYRDKKELAEEVLKMKLKMISPFKENPPRLRYPIIHRPNYYKPSWLKKKEEIMHRRIEQYKDLP